MKKHVFDAVVKDYQKCFKSKIQKNLVSLIQFIDKDLVKNMEDELKIHENNLKKSTQYTRDKNKYMSDIHKLGSVIY